jgi:hypothetical protein
VGPAIGGEVAPTPAETGGEGLNHRAGEGRRDDERGRLDGAQGQLCSLSSADARGGVTRLPVQVRPLACGGRSAHEC